jgi:hypothetical protein
MNPSTKKHAAGTMALISDPSKASGVMDMVMDPRGDILKPEPERDAGGSVEGVRCTICLESEAKSGAPVLRGCACRGTDAGFAHLQCLETPAREPPRRWSGCPTCNQERTGPVKLGMARAWFGDVVDRPAYDLDQSSGLRRDFGRSAPRIWGRGPRNSAIYRDPWKCAHVYERKTTNRGDGL